MTASTFVFACGPWLGKVFPDVMKGKLFTPRRDVFFFGTPAGDDRFSYPNFPNYSEDDSLGYYGFPSFDNRGFKVCPVGEKTVFDPDTDERLVSAYQVKRARDYLAVRFPALEGPAGGGDARVPARDERRRALHRRPAPRARERVARGRRLGSRLQTRAGARANTWPGG